jgi:hypothetical protein
MCSWRILSDKHTRPIKYCCQLCVDWAMARRLCRWTTSAKCSPNRNGNILNFHWSIFLLNLDPSTLKREPTLAELQNVVEAYKLLGFPGCARSVDCMHLFWKNCPRQFKGKYKNLFTGKLAAISCEALCNRNIYCWSWFAGRCGTNNDITVLDHSPFFIDILNNNCRMLLPDG